MTAIDTRVKPVPEDHVGVETTRANKAIAPWKRFRRAALIALGVAAIPYLWVLWIYWDVLPHPLRQGFYSTDFYDLQAQSMLQGHLWIGHNALGIEGFVHDGHTYEFFGIFPSLLRLPILEFVPRLFGRELAGRLTAPMMLLAWLLTWLFVSLLIWKVRVYIRGTAQLGRAETVGLGILVATIMSGSVLVYLASTPYVYNEDFCWSIALTLGVVLALLNVMERPSWGRVSLLGVVVLCNALNRVTTGYPCILAVFLVAGWFAIGRGGAERRRWWWPLLLAGAIPLAAATVVNEIKFGQIFGVSEYTQVWTSLNAHRRYFLAHNGGNYYGLQFLPTNLLAYFQPFGIRVMANFPFITLPAGPATWVGPVVLDKTYRTGSMPATAPLLFLLGLWGTIAAFRRRPVGHPLRLTRIPLFVTALAMAPVMITGYIAPRYLGDFFPFFALAAIVGFVDLWHRLAGRSRKIRISLLSVVAVLGVFSIVANFTLSIGPQDAWRVIGVTRAKNYVAVQRDVDNFLDLHQPIVHGSSLPVWAPADEIYDVGNCAGFFISNGERYPTVPTQQFERRTWLPLQYTGTSRLLRINFPEGVTALPPYTVIMTVGNGKKGHTSYLTMSPKGPDHVVFSFYDPRGDSQGVPIRVKPGKTLFVVVSIEPIVHTLELTTPVSIYAGLKSAPLSTSSPIRFNQGVANNGTLSPALHVTVKHTPPLNKSLCQSIAGNS